MTDRDTVPSTPDSSEGAPPPPLLEYAVPPRDGAAIGGVFRTVLAALVVVVGLALCAEGRERDRLHLVLLGFGCIVAGIFGYVATGRPPRRRVPWVWGGQIVLAIVVCLYGTLRLMVSLSDGLYELRRGRWDRDFVEALAILGAGVAWFATAKLGLRRHWRRAEGIDADGPSIPSVHAYRKRVWAAGVALFLLACAFVAYEIISEKVQIWREYQACASYVAPVDQVVLTEVPAEAAALLQSGAGYDEVPFSGPNYLYWRDKERAQLLAPPLNWALPGWWGECVPFLHARTARDGETSIIVVSLRAQKQRREDPQRVFELQPFAMEPQSWPNPQRVSPESAGGVLTFPLGGKDVLRVFAGQPDPADPSHFTIRYQINGREGFIDGWLDPGRRVRLVDLAGPSDKSQ